MKVKFRTQWDDQVGCSQVGFPPSVVQPGMSPDIASMVKTRSVGGTLDEYEMDGIDTDAPFDSEYLDFFDMQDMIQNDSAVERENAQENSPGQEAPPNDSPVGNDSTDSESEK